MPLLEAERERNDEVAYPRGDSTTYYPALDGLRAFAIIGVVLLHYLKRAPLPGTALGHVLSVVIGAGIYGVDLFFVLSGFLITTILLGSRESQSYFTTFFIRRALRIFPLFYAVLFLLTVIGPTFAPAIFGSTNPNQISFGWFWTYSANWPLAVHGFGPSPRMLPHAWTLAIEEQFYLVWPAVVYFAGPRRLAHVCALLIAQGVLLRSILVLDWPMLAAPYLATLTRLDGLALGAVVAVWWSSPTAVQRWRGLVRPTLVSAAAAIVALYAWRRTFAIDDHGILIVGLPLIAAFFAALLAFVLTGGERAPLARFLSAPALRFVGRYSYAIYVLHYPILIVFNGLGLTVPVLVPRIHSVLLAEVIVVGINATVSLIAARLSWYLLESRFLRLKSRFPYLKPAGTRSLLTGSDAPIETGHAAGGVAALAQGPN